MPSPDNTAEPGTQVIDRKKRAFDPSADDEQLSRPPAALPLYTPLPKDAPPARNDPTWTLDATLDWGGRVPSLRFATLNEVETAAVNRRLRPTLEVEMAASGRMSLELTTNAFALPAGSRFLARFDGLGHLLVWPNSTSYRTLGQGSLRALLSEGRPDVTPLLPGEFTAGKAGKRFGLESRSYELRNSRGQLNIEFVAVDGSGLGGPLLCRWLLELASLQPSGATCAPNWIPVWASITNARAEELTFSAAGLGRRAEGEERIHVPPDGTLFKKHGLPASPSCLLSGAEVAALRKGTAGASLKLVNSAYEGAFLLLGGVRIAFVPPHSESRIGPFVSGSYRLSYRSFFGGTLRPEEELKAPGSFLVMGQLDGGVLEH